MQGRRPETSQRHGAVLYDAAMNGNAGGDEFRDDRRRVRPLAPDAVKRLSALDPVRATLAIAGTLGVIAAAVAAATLWAHPAIVAFCIVIVATRQHALFVLAHDAAHYRLYPSRRLNDAAGATLGAVAGISMATYRTVHRLHHNHLYAPQDPDIALHGGYPRGRLYLLRKLARDLAGLTAWKTYGYFFGNPAPNRNGPRSPRPLDDTSPVLRAAARRDRWFVIAVQGGLLGAAAAGGVIVEYLLLWVLPAATVLQALLRLRAVLEHGAVADTGSPLTAARTTLAPAWLLWLVFPHHVNYHIEHHLYPAVPHYNLPACHRALAASGALRGAEVRRLQEGLQRVFAAPG